MMGGFVGLDAPSPAELFKSLPSPTRVEGCGTPSFHPLPSWERVSAKQRGEGATPPTPINQVPSSFPRAPRTTSRAPSFSTSYTPQATSEVPNG
ncbi:hypothetical protein Dxin01_01598 [Deinococcus xinjiangensis]|uniref:Uncharacterized protein n=1 Tax=Deinococcus xinjiangensis TaxID=457454 RepID=A0ABP9V9A6_9DEIO